MSWITSLWHIALKSAELDWIYNPSFGICHIQNVTCTTILYCFGASCIWELSPITLEIHVTTHPDSLVQVEQWMVHSTFFLNLPTNITNQRFTTTLKVREGKRLSYYGTKLKRLRHSLICTHTTWNQRQNFETYQSILIH